MKLINESRNVFGGSDVWQKSEWLLAILGLVSGCFAVSIVPFIRKDFGERYLGWLNLFFGYSIVGNFMLLEGLLSPLIRINGGGLMQLFWLAFIGLSIYHRREITRKNKAGEKWHSMYLGTSILPLPFSREFVYKFAEPMIVIFAGWLLWNLSGQVGLWLMIAGASLFISNHLVYHKQRQAILDIRDAEIESRNMSKAFQGRPANETGGLFVAESSMELIRQDAGLQEAFANLSPELKQVLDEVHGAQPAPESAR
jgi:hypothetical protein